MDSPTYPSLLRPGGWPGVSSEAEGSKLSGAPALQTPSLEASPSLVPSEPEALIFRAHTIARNQRPPMPLLLDTASS